MVIPLQSRAEPRRVLREGGWMMTEFFVALAILGLAVMPLAYSVMQEGKFFRACYDHAVAMEIVDGEMEILLAGGWRAFKEGTQPYSMNAGAATNLPPGQFTLTITGRHLRLEWLPQVKNRGGKVLREGEVK